MASKGLSVSTTQKRLQLKVMRSKAGFEQHSELAILLVWQNL